jgi:hypothetical protein
MGWTMFQPRREQWTRQRYQRALPESLRSRPQLENSTGQNDKIINGSVGEAFMLQLDEAIRERRSTRMFLPRPVPRELVNEALALAQCAPSNSNIQPWHMVFASGAPRDRLVAALLDEARRRPPNIPPLPEGFQHYRSELGVQVYGAMGIAREDKEARRVAVLRNWEFFRAPLAGIVCMHRDLGRRTPSAWGCSCKPCCWP